MAVEFVTATAVYWASLALRTYLGKRAEKPASSRAGAHAKRCGRVGVPQLWSGDDEHQRGEAPLQPRPRGPAPQLNSVTLRRDAVYPVEVLGRASDRSLMATRTGPLDAATPNALTHEWTRPPRTIRRRRRRYGVLPPPE